MRHKSYIQCEISALDLFYGVNSTPSFLWDLQTLCSVLNLRTLSLLRPDSIRVCQKCSCHSCWWRGWWDAVLTQEGHDVWWLMSMGADDVTKWGWRFRVTERITKPEPWMLSYNAYIYTHYVAPATVGFRITPLSSVSTKNICTEYWKGSVSVVVMMIL